MKDIKTPLLVNEVTSGGSGEDIALCISNLSYIPSRTIGHVISQKILESFPQWEFPLWERLTTDYMRPLLVRSTESRDSVALLHNVTFTARRGKITAILSSEYGERRTIVDLIVGRRKRGVYSGEVVLKGSNLNHDTVLSMNTGFVPRKTLFIPGLTYEQVVRYSARLRMSVTPDRTYKEVSSLEIEQRVSEVLKLMDLWKLRNEVLPEVVPDRGVSAGQLRRLSIAVEIVNYPPLIVVDDPCLGLEPAVGLTIMQALKALAAKGHVVVLAMPTPAPQSLALIDHLVVVGSGYTIYSAPPQDLRSYFCSPDIGYELQRGVELMHWVRDIATGVERPANYRGAVDPRVQQENFEASPFFADEGGTTPNISRGSLGAVRRAKFAGITAFHPSLFNYWGYGQVNSLGLYLHQLYVVSLRALHAKVLEKDNMRRSFGGSILVGLWVGYLNYGVGDYGYYCMTILNYPYVNTSNITAMLFFIGAFIFTQQVMTVQIVCRKVSLFRQEQASGYCGIGVFALASLLSEGPMTCCMAWLFGYIVYFMSSLNLGWDNFQFYTWNIASLAIIGLQTAFLFAVLLRKEILVRDLYLLVVFVQVLLSGFPFELTAITSYFASISDIVPLRWNFESMMAWKFGQNYYDGGAYITPFKFQNFEWYHALGYYHSFMGISLALILVLLLSKPQLMRNYENDAMYKGRIVNDTNSNRIMYWCMRAMSCCGLCGSSDSGDHGRQSSLDAAERDAWMTDEEGSKLHPGERRGDKTGSRSGSLSEAVGLGGRSGSGSFSGHSKSMATKAGLDGPPAFQRIRTAELARPVLFHRESSVTGAESSRLSIQVSADGTQTMFDHGPTVAFQYVTYETRDRTAVSGYSCALDNVSGQFDWGKLSCIMGAPEAGKSTLLHVLAGDTGHRSHVTGSITYDGLKPDTNLPLWQRCALVRANDEQFPSLTVEEVVTYAMELRCLGRLALASVEDNVQKTLDLLHLTDIKAKPVYKLTVGERRRLSIAEEIVHGPPLLLIDEATTGLDALAESVMMRTFREMVNENRTVVATVHQPSAQVFELFDTILLLSKGQVIYHGPASQAVNYFMQSPNSFPFKEYSNPGDYLTDISGGFLEDSPGNKVNGFTLSKKWRKSDLYLALMKRFRPEGKFPINFPQAEKFGKSSKGRPSGSKSIQSSRGSKGVPGAATLVERRSTNESESTDGGDGYALSDAGGGDGNDSDVDSGRLTFSTSTHSYGGPAGKSMSALEAAANTTGAGVVSPRGSTMVRPSSSAKGSFAGEDAHAEDLQNKAYYDNLQGRPTLFREFTDSVCGIFCLCWNNNVDGVLNCLTDSATRQVFFIKASVLLRRSALGIWKRRSVFWGNIFTAVIIALILGWIMGPSGGSIYNTVSFFAVGTLLMMLSNVQLISYLFATHQVFYKDHSRGMYSNFTYWLVASLPLYVLRAVSSLCYGAIIYNMLELVTPPDETFADIQGYFLLVTVLTSIASTMMVEFIIYIVPSIRAAYLLVPAVSFLQFQFSGLFLKPILLPTWMKSWAPSISLIRWTLQGSFLNQFVGSNLFPVLPIYNTLNGFTTLYGWGGKTKWYCFNMVIVFIIIFRIITLVGVSLVSVLRKGGRSPNRTLA